MSSILTDFLNTEVARIRDQAEQQKAAKLDWQRATRELINQMVEWLKAADRDDVLRVQRTDFVVDDYDLGRQSIPSLTVLLGETTVRIRPTPYGASGGTIQMPGDAARRRTSGYVVFDNGGDRLSLYRVRDGDRDVWLWWSQGGLGKAFDRESFEAAVVSLLR